MATQVQWRGGSTAEHATFTGAAREVTVDTQKQTLVVHDGSTAGGEALLREDQANLPGSVTNGIYTPGTNQVAVATNGTGRLFVDANGNVGVGLSGPSYPLEVAAPTDSTINITGGTSNVCRLFFSDTALARGFLNYAHADDSLHIGTAGTERLRIDSAGNVGIGTSSPANFAGFVTLALADSSGAEVDFIKGSTVQGSLYNASDIFYIESKSTVPTAFVTNGSERLRITSAGLVGIGTSSPVATNHIRGSGTSGQVTASWMLENTSSGSVGMDVTGAAGSSIWRFLYGNGPQTGTNAFTPALTIGVEGATAGNVGIGTTSPGDTSNFGRALDINGTTGAACYVRTNGSATNYGLIGHYGTDFYVNNNSNGPIRFFANGDERARIDSSGRLLVGTSTAPSSGSYNQFGKLIVQGNTFSASSNSVLSLNRGEGAASITSGEELGVVVFGDSAGNEFGSIQCVADAAAGSGDYPGRLVFSTTADGASSSTERMRIAQDGLVSIPGVYSFTTAAAANVYVESAGQLSRATSSSKYKINVETIEDVYADALLSCRPVWYRSTCANDNPDWGWWGFIAEEVAAIDPRLVHWKRSEVTYDENGSAVSTPCNPEPEGVMYDRFVPHLLNLIKRQGEAIADLQAEVAALKAQ
jgi:hypothetical protein